MESALRMKLTRLAGELAHATRQVDDETEALAAAQAREATVQQAQAIVQQAAEACQEQAHNQIASVVTRCLQAVFGDDAYTFKIRFSRKRGKTEAELLFCRDGAELDPTEAAGGGTIDVAAFALRLACLVLQRPPLRRFLCLDEPMKFLSKEYRPAVRELLLELSKELGVQILMVTHSPELVCGRVVEL